MSPQDFYPPPRFAYPAAKCHLVRYTGVFAPKHAWRDKIVVKPEIKKAKPCAVSVEADPYADSGQTKPTV